MGIQRHLANKEHDFAHSGLRRSVVCLQMAGYRLKVLLWTGNHQPLPRDIDTQIGDAELELCDRLLRLQDLHFISAQFQSMSGHFSKLLCNARILNKNLQQHNRNGKKKPQLFYELDHIINIELVSRYCSQY